MFHCKLSLAQAGDTFQKLLSTNLRSDDVQLIRRSVVIGLLRNQIPASWIGNRHLRNLHTSKMHLQNHGSLASSGIRKEKNNLGHPKREGCTSARFTGLILQGTTRSLPENLQRTFHLKDHENICETFGYHESMPQVFLKHPTIDAIALPASCSADCSIPASAVSVIWFQRRARRQARGFVDVANMSSSNLLIVLNVLLSNLYDPT